MKQYGVRNATLMAVAPVESSSVVINSTNGIEMPMSLITVKESKAGSLIQVVPEYNKLKSKYQLMWDQKDCVGYLKTAAVIGAYADQSLSTNTAYNPAHFEGRKVPATLIAKNLMLAHYWGLKTMYYSLINKQGSKSSGASNPDIAKKSEAQQVWDELKRDQTQVVFQDDDDCEACKL
jgi:ribonucleoside-diphosphate reductase alpha chain